MIKARLNCPIIRSFLNIDYLKWNPVGRELMREDYWNEIEDGNIGGSGKVIT